MIRDPARQIETISENKKVAQDMSRSLASSTNDDHASHQFYVNVPKLDSYFAVMKYKCVGELRPVPIVSFPGMGMMLLFRIS